MSKPVAVLSRNEILHEAYYSVTRHAKGVDPPNLSSTRVADMIFIALLVQAEVPAYLSRVGEFLDQLDEDSSKQLRTATLNGLQGPVDYNHVVSLVVLMTELWNKEYSQRRIL